MTTLVDVLAQHAFHWRNQPGEVDGQCDCSKPMPYWEHAAHMAEAVAAAGLAVIELPAPTQVGSVKREWMGGPIAQWSPDWCNDPRSITAHCMPRLMTPEDARKYAAALLAAAAAATEAVSA